MGINKERALIRMKGERPLIRVKEERTLIRKTYPNDGTATGVAGLGKLLLLAVLTDDALLLKDKHGVLQLVHTKCSGCQDLPMTVAYGPLQVCVCVDGG